MNDMGVDYTLQAVWICAEFKICILNWQKRECKTRLSKFLLVSLYIQSAADKKRRSGLIAGTAKDGGEVKS